MESVLHAQLAANHVAVLPSVLLFKSDIICKSLMEFIQVASSNALLNVKAAEENQLLVFLVQLDLNFQEINVFLV